MRLCMSPQSANLCSHPLPCPTHGTRLEEVTATPTPELAWLMEPVEDGVLVTLLQGEDRVGTTRYCAGDDGPEGLRRLQSFLLVEASVAA